MSFLRLEALWALPLVLLPILIHLIHRRKHPTVPWAAMMFVGRATQSRRGGAKIKRWLVLLVRTLVVAAILIALARPLSSGLFGLAASQVTSKSTTIVLLDRSPSMQRRGTSGRTRQERVIGQIAGTLKTVGSDQVVLIDSVSEEPQQLSGAAALEQPAISSAADSTANIPQMLRAALNHLKEKDQQVADLWICSDRQTLDWRPDSPLWKEINQTARQFGGGLRVHTFEFADRGGENRSVVVRNVRRAGDVQGGELSLSIEVACEKNTASVVPVQITIDGTTSSVDVQVTGGRGELLDYRVKGSGRQDPIAGDVAIPADVNAADDQWFFSARSNSDRPIAVIAESDCVALDAVAETLGRLVSGGNGSAVGDKANGASDVTIDVIRESVCLIWQGKLPGGQSAQAVQSFLRQGGSAIFFPPVHSEATSDGESGDDGGRAFLGVQWGDWEREGVARATFDDWEFQLASWCPIKGDLVRRAVVGTDGVLAGKMRMGEGTVWFCGADVTRSESPFVKDGLVLYGLLSEALDANRLGASGQGGLTAGREAEQLFRREMRSSGTLESFRSRDQNPDVLEPGHHAGLIRIKRSEGASGQVVSVNRAAAESGGLFLSNADLKELADAVNWNVITIGDQPGDSDQGFVREAWGVAWMMVIFGMLMEAWLTLPNRAREATTWS